MIDLKNWAGSITVSDKVLRQNGCCREPAVAACADSALAVGELLPRYLDRVRPVLCFTRDEVVVGWARDVMLCSTSNVVSMLQTREPVLNVDEVADAVISLQATMNSKGAVPVPPHALTDPRPAAARSGAPMARPVPQRSRVAAILVRLAFIALVIAFFVGFAQLVPDLLVNLTMR